MRVDQLMRLDALAEQIEGLHELLVQLADELEGVEAAGVQSAVDALDAADQAMTEVYLEAARDHAPIQ